MSRGIAVARVLAVCAAVLSLAGIAAAEPTVVLNADSLWRMLRTQGSELMREADGTLVRLDEFGITRLSRSTTRPLERPTCTPAPPAGWAEPDFDASEWARCGAASNLKTHYPTPLILLRGTFAVDDPAKADLSLSMSFEGGAVAYLNGREVGRANLPAGRLEWSTPAEDYPEDAYVAPGGDLLRNRRDADAFPERFAKRLRRIDGLKLPAELLRKGGNCLAIELHHAPAPKIMFTGKARDVHPYSHCWWSRVGLASIELTAAAGAAVRPNVGRPEGLQVWNHPVVQKAVVTDYGDPVEPLREIRITAARNGAFGGQVLVGSRQEIVGLKAAAGDLLGPGGGRIPASAVEVRYAVADGPPAERDADTFDSLEPSPPASVAVSEAAGGAVQPVWVTVHVPAGAAAGAYSGTLTISVAGREAAQVPIKVEVIGWTLPSPEKFATHVGLIQSPESVALQYKVDMWSEPHWRLLEKSFDLLGEVGCKVLYLPLVRRTHFGNEHSMVRWIARDGGGYDHDFSIVERYVATAAKRLGRIPVVVMYCFEPGGSQGHWGQQAPADRDVLISVLDPKTGTLAEAEGPTFGSPASREFWKPVFDGIRKILARHGLEKSMMVGMAGDQQPTPEAVADLAAVAPDAPWVMTAHVYREKVQEQPVGYLMTVWGVMPVWAPGENRIYGRAGRFYGWRNPFRVVTFPRGGSGVYGSGMFPASPQMIFRQAAVGPLMAAGRATAKPEPGIRGFGRVGADFWPVLKDTKGNNRGTLAGYYLEASWGQLKVSFATPSLLGAGREGPVSTERLEMIRESLQEAEARVAIGNAMIDHPDRLGEELAARCGRLLDGQVFDYLRAIAQADWQWYVAAGWREKSAVMYRTAAEVTARLGE